MDEFDRVLNGQDVRVLVLVDVVDHCRQCRRFARTGRPCHQDDPTRILGDLLEYLRARQILQGEDLGRNRPEHGSSAPVLHEGVDPETRQIRNLEGKIALQCFFVVLSLRIVHDVIHHGVHILVLHRWQVDTAYIAVHPDHRR